MLAVRRLGHEWQARPVVGHSGPSVALGETMTIKDFGARLAEHGLASNPARIRQRMLTRPCPHARKDARGAWQFDTEAVAWWVADVHEAQEGARAKRLEQLHTNNPTKGFQRRKG